ncbi:sal-like protein 2 isoform X3 [Loxodonta africana]|uniref:sal-like protein 2 isoform X3 n=1 Tax=Loxodonta africana TaxID=9785 RepID=UPI0030CC1DBB
MSRRKQRKPQQLISDCEGPSASENGDASEEDHPQVCAKCCAQFTDPAEFLAHQNACSTEPPVMVIIGGQENPNNSSSSTEPRPEGHKSPPVMDAEHRSPPDSGSSVPTDPTWGPERRGEEPAGHFLVAATGTAAGGGGGLILASPKLGATPLPPESTSAPPPPPPPPPPPGVGSGHLNIPLILEELRVLQQRQIHQMQMTEQICRQVLLLGSLGQTVGAPASPSELPGTGTPSSTKPLLPLFSPIKPVQTGKTLAPSSSSSSSSSSGAETPKQAFFHLYHPLGTQHPFSAGGVGRSHKPTPAPSPALPGSTDQLIASPHLAFPGTTGLLAAQCLGAARGLEAAASPGLLKPKNGSELGYGEVMGPLEKPGGRHKCRFCAKVFGSDSALQIHLRSHTGERPYKCNVCGNRFTTRGNLKVHFHRHREKYPHVQMNPHPVPEHLDYVITSSGLPYGMSVPPEKAEEEATPGGAVERKPLVASTTALSATESLTLLSTSAGTATAPGLPAFNKFVLMKAVEPKSKADENTPPGSEGSAITSVAESGTATRMQLSKLVTSLPSWALLTNHFKSTGSFPFPYVLEPLGALPSETSKLQQLVEKIDRQGAVAVASTASGAPTTSAPAVSSSASSGPNQCVICLRVLSCPRALRLHYGQHGGERPFKCKVCGRAFSTRGNLRAHFVGHKASPASRAQNSCPICQKKFTNAVTLQQHVRMHLGGQIPNGGTTLSESGGAAQENGSEQSTGSGAGSFPQQQSQQASPEEELSDEEEEEEEEEEDDVTDEDSLAGRGSESGGEKAISVRGDSEEASGAEEEVATVATAGKEMDSNEKATQQFSLPPPPPPPSDSLDQPQPMDQGSSDAAGGTEVGGKPERSSSPMLALTPEGEGPSTVLVEGLGMQEAIRKEPGESSSRKACEVCGQTFPTQAALEEHQKTHTKEGPLFTCIFCKQGFLERATLKKHMLLAHHQNQYTAFLSSGLPTKPWSSSSSSTTPGLAPPVLFGPKTVAGKVLPGTASREAKEKKAPLLLFRPPASKAVPENPIVEEK